MKNLISIILLVSASTAAGQWSNTGNHFYDSLHMPVTTAPASQRNPLVLTSYPDGGYFVIWEDERNFSTTKTDIYAQKYDNAGNALWATGGVPVANGPNSQHYSFSSNQDYRNRSFAVTDSAGGFYICYSDDSVSNYYWERVAIQHVRHNGTLVFPSPGHILATSGSANLQMSAQIIPDGRKGFFIAYKQKAGNDYIHVHCYRDENGTLKHYGGGRVNENAQQTSSVGACGIRTSVVYPGTSLGDYNIWPDGQDGCNIIMDMYGNTAGQGRMLVYNRLWRAKRDARSKTYFRNTSGAACPRINEYQKDDVYILYTLKTDYQTAMCGGNGGPLYVYTNYRLISNGYQVIDNTGYDYNHPKGITTGAGGNINVDLIAVTRRTYANNILSDFIIYGYAYPSEIFDSIPFQHTSYNNPEIGYNPTPPFTLNKINYFRDTLLAASNYYPDFTLSGGSGHMYAGAVLGTGGNRPVKIQRLTVSRVSTDSFSVNYNTGPAGISNKQGVAIGRELNTGFGGTDMAFDLPFIKVAANGNAVLLIRESGRSARISPLLFGTQTGWGAMGRTIGAGRFNNNYYNLEQPVLALDSTGNHGLVVWKDNRFIPGNTGENIYMRPISQLNSFAYSPPLRKVLQVFNPYSASTASPAVLLGTSKRHTPLEVVDFYGHNHLSPIASLLDSLNFGRIQAAVYQHNGAVRRYNGNPYLNRNITIVPEQDITGNPVNLFLYFSRAEMEALQAADNSILDPGYLAVYRQPGQTFTTPNAYAPVAGEEIISPAGWDSVDGGFSLRLHTTGLGQFFIRKIPTSTICAAAGTTFSSNITGSAYQWQVNTGSQFVNISNDAHYSGVQSVTLQINNAGYSFNGFRYRCVVDNSRTSNTFYLQVANTWTGAVNTQWENPANWNCGTVPDSNTNVIVNSGLVTVNSQAICRSLTVSPGAQVTVVPGFNLTVTH